jgi:hypothetical protein
MTIIQLLLFSAVISNSFITCSTCVIGLPHSSPCTWRRLFHHSHPSIQRRPPILTPLLALFLLYRPETRASKRFLSSCQTLPFYMQRKNHHLYMKHTMIALSPVSPHRIRQNHLLWDHRSLRVTFFGILRLLSLGFLPSSTLTPCHFLWDPTPSAVPVVRQVVPTAR